jgi:NADH:ubiquinone oxidoreductase subunit 5 (subunit L)/multisubunit Na+/H+ antiporter MnhA subunit
LLSYLLINFWSSRAEANRSAVKAMLLNKIGDLGLYIFIIFFFFFLIHLILLLHKVLSLISLTLE